MFPIDRLLFVLAVLVLLAILSSRVAARAGVPLLVVFVGIGMLAGGEGLLGIEFENYALAHGIGTLALALILFDGGMRTPISRIRLAWKPAGTLATAGVLLTAALTGAAATWLLGVHWTEGMLVGAIVASTDAAAVFGVLQHQGIHLRERLRATLEVESGVNDPLAVLLTVALIEMATGATLGLQAQLVWLALQMLLGLAAGGLAGQATVWIANRVNLAAAGLYPLLITVAGIFAYAAAAVIGGSGFLAVYIAGVIVGNSRIAFLRGTLLFMDALAWFAQIGMFLMLGLLSFPSRLLEPSFAALGLTAVLIFVARPAAVTACLLPYGFRPAEIVFVAWGGLKGAVPIILATYPLLLGMSDRTFLFDSVFFVVILSALIQGWSLPGLARLLRLEVPAPPEPPVTLEITSLRDVDADIVEYTVRGDSPAAGRPLAELAWPDGVIVAMLVRDEAIVLPRGDSRMQAGDHAFVVLRRPNRPWVDRLFSAAPQTGEPQGNVEFLLPGSVRVGALRNLYEADLPGDAASTLDEALRTAFAPDAPEPGMSRRFGPLCLRVRELEPDGRIRRIGLSIPDDEPGTPLPPQRPIGT